jgi:hypothetical protein
MDITFTLEVSGDENVLDKAHDILLEAGGKIRDACPELPREAIVFSGDNLLEIFP